MCLLQKDNLSVFVHVGKYIYFIYLFSINVLFSGITKQKKCLSFYLAYSRTDVYRSVAGRIRKLWSNVQVTFYPEFLRNSYSPAAFIEFEYLPRR